jgi:hypothetical protein
LHGGIYLGLHLLEVNISSFLETKEQIEKTFNIEYISSLEVSCDFVLEKIKKRVSRRFFPLYDKNHNRWMLGLYGVNIRKKEEAPFYLKKVNPVVGFGVFAKKSIPTLSYIGEYAGELRANRGIKDRENDYIFGYMVGKFGAPWIIDASKKGNFTRFLNHSFNPNISSRGIVVDGLYRVIFFANKAIAKDEQLTYDYGPTYWNKRPYPQNM